MRVKSRWHNKDKAKSVEELAGVVGFNIWKASSTIANKMYNQGFNFKDNRQLLDTIGEFAIFLLQLADRMAYERLDEEQRQRFTLSIAKHLIGTMVENCTVELGPGEYQQPFVDRMNERMDGYAEFEVVQDQPTYPMLRYFADLADQVMGGEQNKWVHEQVLEVEAPELIKTLHKVMNDMIPLTGQQG